MTNSKKANGLFLTMTVCIICFYLFGKGLVTGLPVSIRLISSEIVYLIPVLLCLLIGRDSIGKLIPHRAPRISTLLMTILFVLLLEPLMTCLNVFTMLFSTNYVLETRSDLSIISSCALKRPCLRPFPSEFQSVRLCLRSRRGLRPSSGRNRQYFLWNVCPFSHQWLQRHHHSAFR